MAKLDDLVAAPGLSIDHVAGESAVGFIDQVFVAESMSDLQKVPARALVLISSNLNEIVSSYEFDVALRIASTREVPALVLADPTAPPLTATSVATATHLRIAIYRNRDSINIAELVCGFDAALRGDAELAMRRVIVAASRLVRDRAGEPADLLAEVSKVAAAEYVLVDSPSGDAAFAVGVGDEIDQWVEVKGGGGAVRPELALISRLVANYLGLVALTERRAQDLPIRSRAELLSELLDSSARGRSELLRRARSLGLSIDGWNLAAHLELNEEVRPEGSDSELDEVAAYVRREEIGRIALASARSSGTWHLARADRAILLIQMTRSEPAATAAADATRVLQRAVEAVRVALPGVELFCGVGSAHSGPSGLISSAAEARAAAAAVRARSRVNTATAFDGLGLRQTLIEWYASQTARTAVDTVLAPIEKLSRGKAAETLRTLQAYLDNHGSLSKTAAELHLHRNSVAYRIDRIFAELDVDPDNPDDWLLLQLACRARVLA